MLGQGGARLAKNMQEHVFIDVPRPGNMLAVRGGYTRMRPCRQCHGNGSHESQPPPPPTKGCRQPGPKKVKNSVKFFFALKSGSACGPSNVFFHKNFSHIFHCVARGFFAGFSRFFSHIFSHYFSHGFSRRIFRTSLLRIFLTHFFIAVCCPKGFHSLQSQHCVTVPKTGHTTTCRSSPSLLTQYSHEQVENFKSFWKDKRQIFTLQTIRHKKNPSWNPPLRFSNFRRGYVRRIPGLDPGILGQILRTVLLLSLLPGVRGLRRGGWIWIPDSCPKSLQSTLKQEVCCELANHALGEAILEAPKCLYKIVVLKPQNRSRPKP